MDAQVDLCLPLNAILPLVLENWHKFVSIKTLLTSDPAEIKKASAHV